MATVPRLQQYYQGATTSCSAHPSAYWFANRLRVAACSFVSATALPSPAGLTPDRDLDWSRWPSPSSDLAHGQEQDLPGFLAPHPTTLRRSTTPDDPVRLALGGAAGAAPRLTTL